MPLPLALRLARRETRGPIPGMWTFLACLALGVSAMAAVGSLSEALKAGISAEAATILGGDLEVSQIHQPLAPDVLDRLGRLGRISLCLEMRAMVATQAGTGPAKRALASLKAVDSAYPLTGRVLLRPAMDLSQALGAKNGLYGAVAHADLLARLGAKVGDVIEVGDGRFEIRAVLRQEPDRAIQLLAFGPRLLVSGDGLAQTGLILPGSMIRYVYRLKLADPGQADQTVEALKQAYPEAPWRVLAASQATPSLKDSFQRLGGLLALVGLCALLLGGLGVNQAVAGYLEAKTGSIATFKVLGASSRLVFWIFLPQILGLSLAGVVLGLGAGVLTGWLVAPALGQVLPVTPVPGLYPEPLILAGLFGLLTALAFAIPPLSSRTRVAPLSLFRGYASPVPPRPGRTALAVSTGLGLGLGGLVLASVPDLRLGWGFLGSVGVCLVVFWLVARLLVRLARALPAPPGPRLGLALAALHRPGNPTGQVVACLGLGLTVLACLALSDANFQYALRTELPAQAPAFFFLDIQPRQLEDFKRTVLAVPGVTRLETSPSIRGRIVKVKGLPVDQVQVAENAAWAVRGDRSFTYASAMPPHTALTRGKWWPTDYNGPALTSMDQEVAEGLGLDVGDSLTVNILGREIELKVASLRRVNWLSLALNHVFILSPGVLHDTPMTYLATAYVDNPEGQPAEDLYGAVTSRFANVSVQRVDEALGDVAKVAEQISLAIRICALVTLVAGLLVLAQSLRASLARRVYETVIYKVCGATRTDILAIMLGEHGLAGLAAGLAAVGLGAGLSWFFIEHYLKISWNFFAIPALAMMILAAGLTMVMALGGLWRILSRKAAPYLRND